MAKFPERYASFLFMDGAVSVIRAVTQLMFIAEQFDKSFIARASVSMETLLLLIGPLAAILMCRGRSIGWYLGVTALLATGASLFLQLEWHAHCEKLVRDRFPTIPHPVKNEINFDLLPLACRVGWAFFYVNVLMGLRRMPIVDRATTDPDLVSVGRTSHR